MFDMIGGMAVPEFADIPDFFPSSPSPLAPVPNLEAVPAKTGQATVERFVSSSWPAERTLPVPPSLRALFPDRGLRRGSTVVVSGSTSLALATLAAASAEGSWCAVVGMPSLGCVAAAELNIELGRLALVPRPGSSWAVVTAALLDALDIVVVRLPDRVDFRDARKLSARARERGSVLVPVAGSMKSWPAADLYLRCESMDWRGLGRGYGHLSRRSLSVVAAGKGAASRPRQALVHLAAS